MKPLRSTFRVFGKITMILGLSFLLLAIIFSILYITIDNLVFLTLTIVFLGNSAPWLIIGIIFCIKSRMADNKLKRLKNEGLCYDTEIVQTKQNMFFMRIGSYVSAYIECSYINQKGKNCLIKSDSFLLEHLVNYKAVVYVNRSEPWDYAVEIFIKDEVTGKIDYDYR